MLSNAYFLAKFRFDTAENEPAKNLQKFAKIANFALSPPIPLELPGHKYPFSQAAPEMPVSAQIVQANYALPSIVS